MYQSSDLPEIHKATTLVQSMTRDIAKKDFNSPGHRIGNSNFIQKQSVFKRNATLTLDKIRSVPQQVTSNAVLPKCINDDLSPLASPDSIQQTGSP